MTTRDGSITAVGTEMQSYYGRPILKEPVWQPEIPFYFFFGGIAGASAVAPMKRLRRASVSLPVRRAPRCSTEEAPAIPPKKK